MERYHVVNKKNIGIVLFGIVLICVYYMYMQVRTFNYHYRDFEGVEKSNEFSFLEFYSRYNELYKDLAVQENSLEYIDQELTMKEFYINQYWLIKSGTVPMNEEGLTEYEKVLLVSFFEVYEKDNDFVERPQWILDYLVFLELKTEFESSINYAGNINDYIDNNDIIIQRLEDINASNYAFSSVKQSNDFYKKLKDVEVKPNNTYAVESVLKLKGGPYFILIISLIFPISFLEERKKGLWSIVHLGKNGRDKLALNRLLISLGGTVLISLAVYICLFIISFLLYGGVDCLNDSLQSIHGFEHSLFITNILVFLIIYAIIVGIIVWIVISFVYACLYVTRGGMQGFALIFLGMLISISLYTFVSTQSVNSAFKYMNLVGLMETIEAIKCFRTTSLGGLCVPHHYIVTMMGIIVLGISAATLLYRANKMKPLAEEGTIALLIKKLHEKKERLISKLGLFSTECYMQLVCKKVVFVVLVVLVLVCKTRTKSGVEKTAENLILDEVYSNYAGPLNEDNQIKEYVKGIQEKSNTLETTYNELLVEFQKGNVAGIELFDYYQAKKEFAIWNNIGETLSSEITRLENLKQHGYNIWIVDFRIYDKWFGQENIEREDLIGAIVYIALVLLAAALYDSENNTNVMAVINPCEKKRVFFANKRRVLLFEVFCVWIFTFGIHLSNIKSVYGIDALLVPVKSIRQLSWCVNIPLWFFITILYLLKLVVMYVVALIYSEAYRKMHLKFEQGVLVGIILLIPRLLVILGYQFARCVDIASIFDVIERIV